MKKLAKYLFKISSKSIGNYDIIEWNGDSASICNTEPMNYFSCVIFIFYLKTRFAGCYYIVKHLKN